METQLKLTLEGKVSTSSGKLLIIDPCYLENFDHSPIEQFENEYDERSFKLMEMRAGYIEMYRAIPRLKKIDAFALKEKVEQLEKRFIQELKKFREEPSLNPPYIAQTDNYVYFRNTNDSCPIVQIKEGFHIIFNYPLTANGKTDESRLNGQLLDHSVVDSGSQVIIDPSIASIKKDHEDLYCILNVPKGAYKCKFIQGNDILSIRYCTQED